MFSFSLILLMLTILFFYYMYCLFTCNFFVGICRCALSFMLCLLCVFLLFITPLFRVSHLFVVYLHVVFLIYCCCLLPCYFLSLSQVCSSV